MTGDRRKNCPCCLSSASFHKDGVFDSYICRACDHVFFDASDFEVSQIDYEESEKYENYYIGNPPFLWYHRETIKHLKKHSSSGRVLDFGCFDGFFTSALLSAGFDAYGCDWNRKAIEHGRIIYGLGPRLSLCPEGEYDAIIGLEVIEHFPDPNEFLDTVLPHLAPGGKLILSCPNKNSIYRPKTDSPPHHFSRFSQKSLSTLLIRHRMEIEYQAREMSTFQLIRNLVGDSLRKDAPLLNSHSSPKVRPDYYNQFKHLANMIAGSGSVIVRPFDLLLHAIGFSYIAQIVIARRSSP